MFIAKYFFGVILLVLLLCESVSALDIQVKGLFKNTALVEVDGQQRLLKVGKRSPEGITLISATSHNAVLDVDGEQITLGISQHISTKFTVAKKHEVRLSSSKGGHYVTPGRINGLPVEFMVDTGATLVAMNMPTAKRLGINYRAGEQSVASTANGMTNVFIVNLDSVSIGNVEVKNVRATVHLGESPRVILLGNSYLSRVDMARENGVMILSSRN